MDTKQITSPGEEAQAEAVERPRGTLSVAQILADFKVGVARAMEEATAEAYSKFVNDCDVWTRDDVECNTASHAREAIREMLAGEDPAYVVRSILEYGFNQMNTIRDLIWKRCADELIKKSLEEKDREIAHLKRMLSEVRF